MKRNEIYDDYLKSHIDAVNECLKLLGYNPADFRHDESKFSEEEYTAYANKFYPKEPVTDPLEKEKVNEAFKKAWTHHQNHNPHHWQYWVSIDDKDDIKPVDMPYIAIVEMVADWGAFAFLKKNGQNLLDWYRNNKNKQIMTEKTRQSVEVLVPALAGLINSYYQC